MQSSYSSIRFTNSPLRVPVERLVSEYTGRHWTVQHATDMAEFASHPAAILSDGAYAVFVKLNEAANGLEMFETELAGLRFLSERASALIPIPIGILSVEGGSILVLENVQAIPRTPRHWREIGQALARIHRIKWDRFGLQRHSYFGPLYQDNAPLSDWPAFYAERRLWPSMRLAIDSGHVPADILKQVEKLIARLPELCGPEVVPTLLHGDAQKNNFISTEKGAVVIDPAVYFGHPEMDLAYLDYFQPVPDEVFGGYQDELAIDAGFWERRDLWRVWVHLAIAALDGGAEYLHKLSEAVQRYV